VRQVIEIAMTTSFHVITPSYLSLYNQQNWMKELN